MKYVLQGSNDTINIKKTVLENRGIFDQEKYFSLCNNDLHDYRLLDNIQYAVDELVLAVNAGRNIGILVDSDLDGISSASMMYKYIKNTMKYDNVVYFLHDGKQHGLSKDVFSTIKESDVQLLIIPDGGTNDFAQCKTLREECEMTIIVLDHHEKEFENNDAIIVNNQCCNYPNKQLCGAGIVYKFLQALDEELWESGADKYIDLVALANIGDVMDLRAYETKRLVDVGLFNIENEMFKALLKKREFDIADIRTPTIMEVAFYVVPLVNATIRMGSQEELDLMFRAFIGEYEEFEYTPRKSKNNPEPATIQEPIYDRVARLATNIKARQDKERNKATDILIGKLQSDQKRLNDKVIIMNVTDILEQTLTGLVAIKIADYYKRPTLLLRYDNGKSTEENMVFSGSVRNPNNSFVENFKNKLNESELIVEAIGHQNACGCSVNRDDIPLLINHFNNKYKDVIIEKVVKVDFVLDGQIDYNIIKEIDKLRPIYSSFVEEPVVAVENLELNVCDAEFFGKNGKTHLKFIIDGVEYIKFNIKQENDIIFNIDTFDISTVKLNIIGKPKINRYLNKFTPQFLIEDYELA